MRGEPSRRACAGSSSPTTEDARWMARSRPSRRCRRSWRPSVTRFRCFSTAASGPARTPSKRSRPGATGVLLGRPYAYGLALAGEDGVRDVIRNLLADFDLTLGLSGYTSASELGPEALA